VKNKGKIEEEARGREGQWRNVLGRSEQISSF